MGKNFWCQQNYGTLRVIGDLCQKVSRCSTTALNFTFLAYLYPDILVLVKKDPPPGHTQTQKRTGLIGLIQ